MSEERVSLSDGSQVTTLQKKYQTMTYLSCIMCYDSQKLKVVCRCATKSDQVVLAPLNANDIFSHNGNGNILWLLLVSCSVRCFVCRVMLFLNKKKKGYYLLCLWGHRVKKVSENTSFVYTHIIVLKKRFKCGVTEALTNKLCVFVCAWHV